MTAPHAGDYPWSVDVALAMTAVQKGAILLLVTGVLAPLVGLLLRRVVGGWEAYGKGPFAILAERPAGASAGLPAGPVDPAIQAAEVRQMLEAKAERLRRRGERPIDVEAEATRLLAAGDGEPPHPHAGIDAELRAEVRQLVISRNERRMRRGLQPLDVEAETERQLADLVGSG
jgi:hypothetical protein